MKIRAVGENGVRPSGVDAGTMVCGLLGGVIGICCLGMIGQSSWRLSQVQSDRHPTLLRLSRYGSVSPAVEEIEAELAHRSRVVRIGSAPRTFQVQLPWKAELSDNEVWLTPTWA